MHRTSSNHYACTVSDLVCCISNLKPHQMTLWLNQFFKPKKPSLFCVRSCSRRRIWVEPFWFCLPSNYEQKDCFLRSLNHGSGVCSPLFHGLPATLFVSNNSSKQICSYSHLIIYWHRKTHRQCFLWIVSYIAGQKQVRGFAVWHKLSINLYAWCYDDALAT